MKSFSSEQITYLHSKYMEDMLAFTQKARFDDPAFYALWLAQMYHFKTNFGEVLGQAAQDPAVDRARSKTFSSYADENDVDKLALIQDLGELGWQIDNIAENSVTKRMYDLQGYFLRTGDPISVLGAVLYLKGLSLAPGQLMKEVCTATYGASPGSFLKGCSLRAGSCSEDILAIFSSLAPKETVAVEWNMRQMSALYGRLTDKLLEQRGEFEHSSFIKAA